MTLTTEPTILNHNIEERLEKEIAQCALKKLNSKFFALADSILSTGSPKFHSFHSSDDNFDNKIPTLINCCQCTCKATFRISNHTLLSFPFLPHHIFLLTFPLSLYLLLPSLLLTLSHFCLSVSLPLSLFYDVVLWH